MKYNRIIRRKSQSPFYPSVMYLENEKGIPTNYYFTGYKVILFGIYWDEYKSEDGEVIYL